GHSKLDPTFKVSPVRERRAHDAERALVATAGFGGLNTALVIARGRSEPPPSLRDTSPEGGGRSVSAAGGAKNDPSPFAGGRSVSVAGGAKNDPSPFGGGRSVSAAGGAKNDPSPFAGGRSDSAA